VPITRTPRGSWIEAGLKTLADGGPEAVRIEPLAKSLGVTKGSFYWHFEDRQALLEELLDAWERTVIDDVVERVEREGGDAKGRLRELFSLAASGVRAGMMGTELAIRDWARHDDGVATRLRRVDNRRMDYMRSLFGEICDDEDDVEARCLLSFSLFIGSGFIAADHGGRSRVEVLARAMRQLGI
jgi:AcrR family transcriptional regulator